MEPQNKKAMDPVYGTKRIKSSIKNVKLFTRIGRKVLLGWQEFICGGVSGALARTITSPLNIIKTLSILAANQNIAKPKMQKNFEIISVCLLLRMDLLSNIFE